MRLTQTHLAYWQSKQPIPSWGKNIKKFISVVCTIDQVVNAHAGWLPQGSNATHNTVALLKMVRQNIRNGITDRQRTMKEYLGNHQTRLETARRSHLFQKYYKKLQEVHS